MPKFRNLHSGSPGLGGKGEILRENPANLVSFTVHMSTSVCMIITYDILSFITHCVSIHVYGGIELG